MSDPTSVCLNQTRKLGLLIRKLNPFADDFLDTNFFPNSEDDSEDVARFFFFTTSIDHRTSPPGQSFEGLVNGHYFQGADLLWHLSLQKYHQNPSFFAPSHMADMTTSLTRKWFTLSKPSRVTIRNPAERAKLLKDCGQQLIRKYDGSVLVLLNQAHHRLTPSSDGTNPGILSMLSQFKAYEDPAKKKSLLLLKFLLRRQLWTIEDSNQLHIPVDNHLIRIALRTGIITISPTLAEKLKRQQPISIIEDIALRRVVADAFSLVAHHASRFILELDDFLWHFGRQCCLAKSPTCTHYAGSCTKECYVAEQLLPASCSRVCPLSEACLASTEVSRISLVEPKVKTWYY
ncbi:MAG: queuosine salvage family protein [Promethearchaeota archaeon]